MNIKYFKDERISDNPLGIISNKIVEVDRFITAEKSLNVIKYIDSRPDSWGDIYFYGSSGMSILLEDPKLEEFGIKPTFFKDLLTLSKDFVSSIFERKVVPVSFNIQKWDVGGYAIPHSDNSDFDGIPNAYEKNKYVSILYLNEDYAGGELYFPNHDISIKPKAGGLYVFPGGFENLHGVKEVESGSRYTIVIFWDHEESSYSDEKKMQWQKEIDSWVQEAKVQKEIYTNDLQRGDNK